MPFFRSADNWKNPHSLVDRFHINDEVFMVSMPKSFAEAPECSLLAKSSVALQKFWFIFLFPFSSALFADLVSMKYLCMQV